MRTAICRLDLGFTRVAGFTIYNAASKDFDETTPREVKDLIKQAGVNGIRLNKDEDIELDAEGFNMHNLMVKSACGKYRTLYPTTSIVNCMYAVVRVIETDNGRLYEVINNKCGRVKITPDRLKILIEVGCVAGVKMGADGEIEICKGVIIENKRTKVEQFESITQTEVKECEQSLQSLQGDSIEAKTASTVEGDEKSAEKSAESVANESTNQNEQEVNSLEVIFDSLDVTAEQADVNTNSDDTSIDLGNTEVNKDDSPTKEQVEEKKTTTPRKNKKK